MKIKKKTLLLGLSVAAAGFVVLTWTDPQGQNWASHLSPFLLVLGYVLMGAGLVLQDPVLGSSSISSSPSVRSNRKKKSR